jgi:hypothetical protein
MFGFIRSISFTVQAMIPILGLILFGIAWFLPGTMSQGTVYGNGLYFLPKEGWLYTFWLQVGSFPLWVQIVPSYLTAIITGVLIAGNDMKNLLVGRRSYAMAIVFLFLVTSGGHFSLFHPAFLAGLLIVLSQRFLLDVYKRETEYSIVFMVGFTWGVAILLYPPVILLTPAILVGLLFMVATGWRHWVVIFLGIAVPLVLVGSFWFLLGDLHYEIDTFLSWFKIRKTFIPAFFQKEPFIAAWFGLILIWIVIASIGYRNPKIQSRQLFQSNFLMFVFVLLITIFLETVSVEFIWLLMIPTTYIITFWVLDVKREWMRDLFFFTLLLAFTFFRIRELVL